MEKILNTKDVADLLGITRGALTSRIFRKGDVPRYLPRSKGQSFRFHASDVIRWMNERDHNTNAVKSNKSLLPEN